MCQSTLGSHDKNLPVTAIQTVECYAVARGIPPRQIGTIRERRTVRAPQLQPLRAATVTATGPERLRPVPL